jgi:hypothetical protein
MLRRSTRNRIVAKYLRAIQVVCLEVRTLEPALDAAFRDLGSVA